MALIRSASMRQQVYPYLSEVPAVLRAQLNAAVRGAAACLDITTTDNILEVEVGLNHLCTCRSL